MGQAEVRIPLPKGSVPAVRGGADTAQVLRGFATDDVAANSARRLHRQGWEIALDAGSQPQLIGRRSFATAGAAEVAWRQAGVPTGTHVSYTATASRGRRRRRALLLNDYAGARDVFLGALLGHLQRTGAKTVSQMNVHWYYTRLNDDEVRRVVEAARIRRLIEPVGHDHDAYDDPIDDIEWAPTDEGMKVKPARGLGPNDVRHYLVDALRAGFASKEFIATALTVLAFLAGLAPKRLDLTGDLRVAVVAIAVAALFALVVYRGIREDRKLQQGARAWPGLAQGYRRWQSSRWRMRLEATAWTLLIGCYALVALDPDLWRIALAFAAAAAVLGGALRSWRVKAWGRRASSGEIWHRLRERVLSWFEDQPRG